MENWSISLIGHFVPCDAPEKGYPEILTEGDGVGGKRFVGCC